MTRSQLIGSAVVIRELKKYEPEVFKALSKDLKSDLNPILKGIESEINSEVTAALREKMRGMFHSGRSSWSGATLSVRLSTNPKSLISISATGRSGKVGFNYAELAGIQRKRPRPVSRSYVKNGKSLKHRVDGQGLAFNAKLMQEFGKPGRFAWIRVLKSKPEIEKKVERVVENYNIKVMRRISA